MNIEVGRNPELRRGIAPFPFGEGIEIKRGPGGFTDTITTKPIRFGDLGNVSLRLLRPLGEAVFVVGSRDDRAFSIGLSGEINRGGLHDFLRKGYYIVIIEIQSDPPIDETSQKINVNTWIEGTKPIVTADLEDYYHCGLSLVGFRRIIGEKGTKEEFVLPNNPEILHAVRINVSSRQESPIDPKSA